MSTSEENHSARGEGAAETRGARMRRELLSKLSLLPYRGFALEHLEIGKSPELGVAIELDADALLEPLEALVPAGRK